MIKDIKLKIGDWISWYDYGDGKFEIGEVQKFGERGFYPHDDFAYTSNGAINFEDITEIRRRQ